MAACDTGKTILYIRSILWDLNIPQEAATLLYKDNDGCTAMGRSKTNHTYTAHRHQVLLPLRLGRMGPHATRKFTKALQPTLFHRHADFLLGHIPPTYSPVYLSLVGLLPNHTPNVDKFIPGSFTTPDTAHAARTFASLTVEIQHNPWVRILCMGTIQPPCQLSLFSTFGLWGGVSI
jgi:hypothetical protein